MRSPDSKALRHQQSRRIRFGRDQMQPGSDIDILVQIDSDIGLLEFVGLKLELEEALNKNVDLVEYDTINPLLRESILKEQRVILCVKK